MTVVIALLGTGAFGFHNVSPASATVNSSRLGLPFATGETWSLWGGPHNANGAGGKPWNSLDFANGTGNVRAAGDGIVSRPCANLVVIDHGGGLHTSYYHLVNIAVAAGQMVGRGQFLGNI